MGYVIATANMKGGVGKTTTTVSLADCFAASGYKVLVVDLDAQANASVCVVGTQAFETLSRTEKNVGKYFERNVHAANHGEPPRPLSKFWANGVSTVSHRGKTLNITLLAATPDIRYLEREILLEYDERGFGLRALETKLAQILGRDLTELKQVFDFILFDCAPGISPFSEAAIRLADLIIAPTIPDFISVQGLPLFCNYLTRQQQKKGTQRPGRRLKPYVLATRVRSTTTQHQTYLQRMRDAAAAGGPYEVFETSIPDSIRVSEAIGRVESLTTYQQRWNAIVDELETLRAEINEVLDANAI